MEKTTVEMTEDRQALSNTSVLQSMLNRLKAKERVQPSGLRVSQHDTLSKDVDQSECEFTQKPGNPECTSAQEDVSEISQRLDHSGIILGSDTAEKPAHSKLGTDFRGTTPPLTFPRCDRRKQACSSSYGLMKEVGQDLHPSKSHHPECENMREEGTLQAESQTVLKDSPVQQQHGPLMHSSTDPLLPTSISVFTKDNAVSKENEFKTEPRQPPSKPPRSNLKSQGYLDRKGRDVDEEMLNKVNHKAKKDLESKFSKSAQSVSDVENYNRRDETDSDPNGHKRADMDFRQAQDILEQEPELETIDGDSASSRMQKRVKTITQKLKTMLKERNSTEQNGNENSHQGSETQPVPSVEETESPARTSLRLLPSTKDETPTTVQVSLQRTFTLRDFTLNLEPINLLEEILKGEEWASFLPDKNGPHHAEANKQSQEKKNENLLEDIFIGGETTSFLSVKDSPAKAEDNDCSQTDNTWPLNDDIKPQNLVKKQDKPSDQSQSVREKSEKSQASTDDNQLNTQEKYRQNKSDSCDFAQKKLPENDHFIDNNVYEFVEVSVPPRSTPKWQKTKDFHLFDFSVIKSLGILDNSALKSRIHLSKKRKHRPPKLRKKGKSEVTFNSGSSAFTTSSPIMASQTTVFPSSIFYGFPHLSSTP